MVNGEIRPFVIFAEDQDFGMLVVGVELGVDEDDAFYKAVKRLFSPHFSALVIVPWAQVRPEVRLLAIDCDRQMPVEFNLHVGVLL